MCSDRIDCVLFIRPVSRSRIQRHIVGHRVEIALLLDSAKFRWHIRRGICANLVPQRAPDMLSLHSRRRCSKRKYYGQVVEIYEGTKVSEVLSHARKSQHW